MASLVSFEELARVEAHVKSRLDGRVRRLRLSVRGSGLVLRGTSESYYVKQLAQHAAMEVSELPILANEIEVAQRASPPCQPAGDI